MSKSNSVNFIIVTLGLVLMFDMGFNVYYALSRDSIPKMNERIMKLEKALEVKD